MFIRCRLRRFIFFYKFVIIGSVIFLIFLICFGLLELLFNRTTTSHECLYQEQIDVVYTWVNGSDPLFIQNLNKVLKGNNSSSDSSKARFDDKYELKFSLRSLEKYAPWINHVYIVTNGQIPYWLNLDYDKVSIITHEEIFKDNFNLPTFSSPAIECNLHRISGLSNKFIYFNDDIFLAAPTYIEDFYAPNKGFLIYLAWPVPNCAPYCPWLYVSDGQCDKDCFNPECQMDGGDCDNFDLMNSDQNVNTEDLEILREETETRNKYLAEAIVRVRKNFYNSFLKKLMPMTTNFTVNHSLSVIPHILLDRFNGNNITRLTNFVNEHNKKILEKDRLKRKRKHKRRNTYNSYENILERLQPNSNFDAYSASLQHTNRILNTKYGFKNRKVPSHAPIMIDKNIMNNMQSVFAKEFDITESNKVRRENDVQFSFSYYYFVISETIRQNIEEIFDNFDTDSSSTWSDREIRTLLTKLYELPLSYATVDHLEAMLLNCSENGNFREVHTPLYERYIDSKLPTITKNLIIKCPSLKAILLQRFGSSPKYNYEIISNSESRYVSFKMLNSNISDVVSNLDDIRSQRTKFVCLNDNLDESKENENELVRAILYDFYLSLFPSPSKFELPEDFRNKFLYMKDLNEWKSYRSNIKLFLYCIVVFLLYLTIYNLFKKKCCKIINAFFC